MTTGVYGLKWKWVLGYLRKEISNVRGEIREFLHHLVHYLLLRYQLMISVKLLRALKLQDHRFLPEYLCNRQTPRHREIKADVDGLETYWAEEDLLRRPRGGMRSLRQARTALGTSGLAEPLHS